jgi:glycosyltransferase involved in cell wall biosynthesis
VALRRRIFAKATGWLAPKPSPQTRPTQKGLIIVGELSRASGMGETARLMAAAAVRLNLPVWTVDLPPPVDARAEVAVTVSEAPPPGVPLVVHVNAPMLPLALLRLPTAVRRNRAIVGYWAWEMPEVPPEWRPALACVSQIWVPSRFTAAVLEPLLPGRVRVVPPALALVPPVASTRDRAAFGLPDDAVVVLVSFNLASSFTRKNPFAAIAAFRGAFGDRADRILVLKVGHPEHAPADFARLVQMAHAPNIRIETHTLPPEDRHALTACADIVLSLHRGEGFGLVLAEAMLLGKPVVATGWSGNTDYMDAANAALVGYRLAPARDDRLVYRGLWAEPDVAEAAVLLRGLADDADLRRDLGERARVSATSQLDGRALTAALEGLT